jgi:hypothetical protein
MPAVNSYGKASLIAIADNQGNRIIPATVLTPLCVPLNHGTVFFIGYNTVQNHHINAYTRVS